MNIFFLLNVLVTLSLKQYKSLFCYNCKHFIKNDMGIEYGKCGIFPKINNDYTNYLITDIRDIESKDDNYYYCGTVRSNDDMCGENGSLYRKKYDIKLVNQYQYDNNKKLK